MLAELQQVADPFVAWCTRHRDCTWWCCYLYWWDRSCFWWSHWNIRVFWRCTYSVLRFIKIVNDIDNWIIFSCSKIYMLCLFLADYSVISYWHDTVVCLSICPSVFLWCWALWQNAYRKSVWTRE